MLIEGEKDAFVEVGQAALRVVSARATLPVLGGIRITAGEQVEFASTDLEMFVSVRGALAVKEPGVVVVPGRLFGEVVRSLPAGRVVLRGGDPEVVIESGKVEFSLSSLRVEDFPEFAVPAAGAGVRVVASELARALKQVVRAASADEARPVLTGVLWSVEGEALRLVATDSYRLAVKELSVKEAPAEAQAIIPGRALSEFGRHLGSGAEEPAVVTLRDTQAMCEVEGARLVTRLIEGEFPNYRRLIPQGYTSRLVANRTGLLEAVQRVGVVAQVNTPIKLHLGDEVRLTASESGVGEAFEVLEGAEYSGEPMVVAFNTRFLGEGLDAVEGERAVVEVGDPTKPALVKGEDREDFTYLVMPVRLSR